MRSPKPERGKIFISYSHQDRLWLDRLRVHLRPLERSHSIEIWDDTMIKAGSRWSEEIRDALATAKIAVLLVSADFLASDFITTNELPPLLGAAEVDGAIILPLILSPSRFLKTEISKFQAVNDPAKPLIELDRGTQERLFVNLADRIETALGEAVPAKRRTTPRGSKHEESRQVSSESAVRVEQQRRSGVTERVLLVDNNRGDLEAWAKALRQAGYEVQKSSSEAAARKHLDKGGFDFAVVDLHLHDDDDDDDDSGLRIAKSYGRLLPIIILTGKPTYRLQRLSRQGRRPPAADFVLKADGPEGLLEAIREVLPPRIFISHGHDELATTELVGFLKGKGTKPINLRDGVQGGQPLLDAFEELSNVAFAVVLVTSSDEGHRQGEPPQSQAQQNIGFELGFLLAKLGRDRVLVLYEDKGEPIEWPSGYEGILYLKMDSDGAWKDQLRQALGATGIELG